MWPMGGVGRESSLTSRQPRPTTDPGPLSLTTFPWAASTPDPVQQSLLIFHQVANSIDPGRRLDLCRPGILRPFLPLLLLLRRERIRMRLEEGGGLPVPARPLLLRW